MGVETQCAGADVFAESNRPDPHPIPPHTGEGESLRKRLAKIPPAAFAKTPISGTTRKVAESGKVFRSALDVARKFNT